MVSTLLEISLLALFPIEGTFSGLHSLIFSLLVLYWADVPPFYRFTLFGIPANSKLFSYGFAFQVRTAVFSVNFKLLLSRPTTATQALAGILVGILYRLDLFGTSNLTLPSPLLRLYHL